MATDPDTMFIAALILLSAVGLATWAWFAMAHVDEELRSLTEFEGLHFGIGPQDTQASEASPEAIPLPVPSARRGRDC